MSQLAKAVLAHDTGRRQFLDGENFSPLFRDLYDAKESVTEHRAFQIGKEYRIDVRLGNSCFVNELDDMGYDSCLTEAIHHTRKQIVEAVFGEFREDFLRIRQALWNNNRNEAAKLLAEFEHKMYSTED